jgi:hypothetical protein
LGTTAIMYVLQKRKIPATDTLNDSSVDISVLLGSLAAAHVGSWLQAFWDDLWVQSSRVQQDPEDDTDYQSTPSSNPKDRRFQLHRNGRPKTRFHGSLALGLVTM